MPLFEVVDEADSDSEEVVELAEVEEVFSGEEVVELAEFSPDVSDVDSGAVVEVVLVSPRGFPEVAAPASSSPMYM